MVSDCYATGSVTGDYFVGGLVGYNSSGTVSDCYASGTVDGGYYVGGLVGYNNGTVSGCYATGSVTGGSDVGGLVGYNYSSGTVSASFWDVDTSGTMDGVGNEDPDPAGVVGETTAHMMQQVTFTGAGWDFLGESANGDEDPWRMCSDGVDYPRLRWEYDHVADWLCPDGTTLDDLGYLSAWWGESGCDETNDHCDGVDIDRTGTVDLADLLVLVDHWFRDTVPPSVPQNLVQTGVGDTWASMWPAPQNLTQGL